MYMEGRTLHANFYGTHDGRSVQLAGPNVYGYTAEPDPFVETVDYLAPGQRVIKEYGQGGFSAWWKRTITYPDGEQVEETIDTTYTGKKGIVLQGPSAAPEDSASESSSEG